MVFHQLKKVLIKIVHICSVHFQHDPRIVFRECASLSKKYETYLILPKAAKYQGIKSISLPFFKKLWMRFLFVHPILFFQCLKINAKIYHFHSPELIPIGLILKLFRKKIIFDVHENLALQIKNKENGLIFRKLFPFFNRLAKKHFYFIFAEKSYSKYFSKLKKPCETILNFPQTELLQKFKKTIRNNKNQIRLFYIGGISFERCIDTIVDLIFILKQKYPEIKIDLVGEIYPKFEEIKALKNFKAVKENLIFHGKMPHNQAFELSLSAQIGIAFLKPIGNYFESYPSKIFEYMTIGLPFVTSDFPIYKKIVEESKAGFCVESSNAQAISEKIIYLLENENESKKMSKNGISASEKMYNWKTEEQKLFTFYERILSE